MTDDSGAAELRETFRRVRRQTAELAAPLAIEDYVVQSLPEARPAKWHVGHTSWYFETFVLGREGAGQAPIRPDYREIFGVSDAGVEIRHDRGVLSRPTVAEVYEYRRQVDDAMSELLADELPEEVRERVVLGLHHEQQHQERMLADLKHLFSRNPLHPAYREASSEPRGGAVPPLRFVSFAGGRQTVGYAGTGFAYDNERPRHERLVAPFQLGSRLITNDEYREFIEEGGYRERSLWLADGWEARVAGGWEAPLHWVRQGDGFNEFSLAGLAPLAPAAPVVHVSCLRGRRLRALAGGAAAHRVRMGVGGGGPAGHRDVPRRRPPAAPTRARRGASRGIRPGAALRRRLGVDGQPLPPLPPLPPVRESSASRAAVPCPAAWCSAAAPASPPPPTSAPHTATSSAPTRAGRPRASASPATDNSRMAPPAWNAGLQTGTVPHSGTKPRTPTHPHGTAGLERRSPDRHARRSAPRMSQPHPPSRRRRPGPPVFRPASSRRAGRNRVLRRTLTAPRARSAGLRPASRGSAKPVLMAQRHANERSPGHAVHA